MAMSEDSVAAEVPGLGGVSETDLQAYEANYSTHRVGISNSEVIKCYDSLAPDYEKHLCPGRYNGPEYAARTLAPYFRGDEASARILDVAAGTGLVGHQLQALGFNLLDALEPAAAMLKTAEERDIYTRHICAALAGDRLDLNDDSYHGLVVSGGMGEGHIPCCGLREMIRIVKPGGVVCIVMRLEYLSYVTEYVGRLEPFMAELASQGKWRAEERRVVPAYSFGKEGIIFVFRVLEAGFAPIKSQVLDN